MNDVSRGPASAQSLTSTHLSVKHPREGQFASPLGCQQLQGVLGTAQHCVKTHWKVPGKAWKLLTPG